MKIAFITLGFPPVNTSGLDVSGGRLVKGLLEQGHIVTVIAGKHKNIAEVHQQSNLTIYRIPLDVTNWIGFSIQVAKFLKKLELNQKFDIVHFWDVHFAYAYHGNFVASVQHSFRQRWLTLDKQNLSLTKKAFRFSYYASARILAEQPALKQATGLLAGSQATLDEYVANYGLNPTKIKLARHGIDTDFFQPKVSPEKLRFQLGLSSTEAVILFVGFATPRKGLSYLMKALPHVEPKPRLLLIGQIPSSQRDLLEKVMKPMTAQIIEIGYVPDALMPAYYNLADVYVSASLLEGFGLPLAEALACQTPVVATNTGSTAEVVGPGGVLVHPKDYKGLAQAISRLLQNSQQRQLLGIKGPDAHR